LSAKLRKNSRQSKFLGTISWENLLSHAENLLSHAENLLSHAEKVSVLSLSRVPYYMYIVLL
jgi:hypothetical protein